MKNIALLFLSVIVFYIKNTSCSELIDQTIPTIEVIQPVENTQQYNNTALLYVPINNNSVVESAWEIPLFTLAIEKKLCPSVLGSSGSGNDKTITINIAQALATFRSVIDEKKDLFFKGQDYFYEILFPSRNQSPIKNINNNGSPRSTSPINSRRTSGSGESFYKRFSVDPQETTKECILKNEQQKKLFIHILAYCIVNLNPHMLNELYEKITQPFQSNAIKLKTIVAEYNELTQKHDKLTTDSQKNLNYINELELQIKTIKSAIEQSDQSSADSNSGFNNNVNEQIEKLKQELEIARKQNNVYFNELKETENIIKELRQNNDRLSLYRLISGIGFSTTIILLLCLLYNNNLLSAYYAHIIY